MRGGNQRSRPNQRLAPVQRLRQIIQCVGLPAEQSQPASRFAAYLKAEADTGIKHEYRDGYIVAMAGGSPAHSAVAAKILGELHAQLKSSPCQPHG